MNNHQHTSPELSEIVDRAINRLVAGEKVDITALYADHPSLRQELEAILPAIQAMAEFGKTANGTRSAADSAAATESLSMGPCDLGDFRILREIGRGGMGVVYEAMQLSLRRLVALKVLPFAAMLDSRQLERFKHEAQAAAALRHPHIVSVHSVGCERGVHFYAMDLVDGPSLAEVIHDLQRALTSEMEDKFERVPESNDTQPAASLSTQHSSCRQEFFRRVAELGIQAARALQYAHECGIVHRDIKPSNLLIDRDGKLWVTDFGLAMTQAGDGLTLTGDLIGTLRYMSPEQAAGDRSSIAHQTDIYSLGASLYELLALCPAFQDNDRQSLLKQIDERDPPQLRRLDGEIPRDLETVVAKAMAKQPQDRYAVAGELADDLQRFLDLKPVRARKNHSHSTTGKVG